MSIKLLINRNMRRIIAGRVNMEVIPNLILSNVYLIGSKYSSGKDRYSGGYNSQRGKNFFNLLTFIIGV